MRASELWKRLTAMFRRDALDRDFDEELAAHVAMATDDYLRQGVPADEARRRALARFGGMTAARQQQRESRGLPAVDALVQDVRGAVRALGRSPGFTLTAIAMLAVGIGVNTAVFTLTSGLFKGFAQVDDNDRLLYFGTRNTERPDRREGVSYPDFEDWRAQTTAFTGLAACRDVLRVNLRDERGTDAYWAVETSTATFRLVGRAPALGRDFSAMDEQPGAAPVAILSHGLWERRYAADPAIVGRAIAINGTPTTVIGVMPRGFTFPNKQDLWLPLTPAAVSPRRDARDTLMFVVGRLADGVGADAARAELSTIGRRLAAAHPDTNGGFLPVLLPFDAFFHGSTTTIYQAMWGAVGFVLLIACANLANLMLGRAIGRSRELAVRLALGASRWRIVRPLVVESLLLSAAGAALGWWIAGWCLDAYVALAFTQYHPLSSPDLYPWYDFTMDHRALAYLVAIATATALLFGLAPAGRLGALDIHETLKAGGRGPLGSGRQRRLSSTLVAGELALAIVLLGGAGMLVRTVLHLYTADVGVDASHLVSTFLQLHCDGPACANLDARYPTPEAHAAFFERATSRLGALPQVAAAAIASRPPAFAVPARPYEVAGASAAPRGDRPATIGVLAIGDTYFQTLGAPLLRGRDFTSRDGRPGALAAIVNERFAARHWPGQDPVGQHLRLLDGEDADDWLTVVGVARDIVQDFNRQSTQPLVYVPYAQSPAGAMWLVMRTTMPVDQVAPALRREIQALEPDLPLFDLQPLALGLRVDYRFNYAVLLGVFAGIALLLASVGLFAVVAHAVGQRTQEIGVRVALGATRGGILWLVLRQALRPLVIGLAVGLAATAVLSPVLKSVLVNVAPGDPLTLAAAAAMLSAAALVGCLVPARRALRVDPVEALRCE